MTTPSREPGPLARRLATLRWRACLSRDQLAKLSGVSAHIIQSLEQGRVGNPTLRTLLGLAQGLGGPRCRRCGEVLLMAPEQLPDAARGLGRPEDGLKFLCTRCEVDDGRPAGPCFGKGEGR